MNKKVLSLICFFASVLVCPFAANSQDARFSVDKVVANVGNSTMLYSDVITRMTTMLEQGQVSGNDPFYDAFEALLTEKLLYNQAIADSVEVNTAMISAYTEGAIEALLERYDNSLLALEKAMSRTYTQIKDDCARQAEEIVYARQMYATVVSGVTVTPLEVEQYYRDTPQDSMLMVPEQYVYAQITKYPSAAQDAVLRARERMLGFKQRIVDGDPFSTIARMYSDGSTRSDGGIMHDAEGQLLAPEILQALSKLSVGQLSDVIETDEDGALHLVQLIAKKPRDMYDFRHIMLRPQYMSEELAEAERFLDSLVQKIRVDSITFERAALLYSDDKYSRLNGGVVSRNEYMDIVNDNRFSAGDASTRMEAEAITPLDYIVISALKPGEVSDAFQSADLRGKELGKIIKLVEVIPSHKMTLANDYMYIEQYALAVKQEKEFQKWLDDKISGMFIRISPEFRDGQFQNKNWVK